MALDEGTTSSRAILFDHASQVLGMAQERISSYDPQQAPARAGLQASDLAALGVANQREAALLWDTTTGRPLGNAMASQCRRTEARCEELRQAGSEPLTETWTGLRLDPYFSATKFEWLLDHNHDTDHLLAEGQLGKGTGESASGRQCTG